MLGAGMKVLAAEAIRRTTVAVVPLLHSEFRLQIYSLGAVRWGPCGAR